MRYGSGCAGVQFIGLSIVGYVLYGISRTLALPADALVRSTTTVARILIAAVFFGLAVLNLLWFAAALRTTLADAGQDGWGAAPTASSDIGGPYGTSNGISSGMTSRGFGAVSGGSMAITALLLDIHFLQSQ